MPNTELDFSQFAFAEQSDWGRCLKDFLQFEYSKSGSIATLKAYCSNLQAFFRGSANDGPPKMPDRYSKQDCIAFIHAPSRFNGRPVGAGTMNMRRSAISAFYQYAATYTLVQDADGYPVPLFQRMLPTSGLRAFKQGPKRGYVPTLDDLKKLFAVIPTDTPFGKRDRAMFLVAFWCARRRMEILRIRWGDIQESTIIENGVARRAIVYSFTGKGQAGAQDLAEMPPIAYRALLDYLEATGRLATIQPDDALFAAMRVAPYGKQPNLKQHIAPQTAHAALKRYCLVAGIKPFSLHAFRHAAARARFSAGSSLTEISQLLRHKDRRTTEIYLGTLVAEGDPGAKLLEPLYGNL